MTEPGGDETIVSVSAFKAKCHALIDQIARGRTRRMVLTKHGRPVAVLVPAGAEEADLWGALKGTVRVAPGTDLTQPTGEVLNADGRRAYRGTPA